MATDDIKTLDPVVTPDPDTTTIPEAADADPVSVAEADAGSHEPEIEVTPDEAASTEEPAPASSEDVPAPRTDPTFTPLTEPVTPPLSEDPKSEDASHSDEPGADRAGDDSTAPVDGDAVAGPLPETAPEAPTSDATEPEAEKAADEFVPPYGELHAVAKPLAEALGDTVVSDLRDAGNALFKVTEEIAAADLEEVQGDGYWILSNIRNQSVGVLAAVEAVFKRVR